MAKSPVFCTKRKSVEVPLVSRRPLRTGRHWPVRSAFRISDPHLRKLVPYWNVRAIVPWGSGKIIMGSEDGDIVEYDVLNNKTLECMRYTPTRSGVSTVCL